MNRAAPNNLAAQPDSRPSPQHVMPLHFSQLVVKAGVFALGFGCLVLTLVGAEPSRKPKLTKPVGNAAAWVEADFPYFSSVLDSRKVGAEFPDDNLTPRGIILNLGNNCWACFDPDLLRVSAVWRGLGVSPKALAPRSYPAGTNKTPAGQKDLPTPTGNVSVANGIYPGWQTSEAFSAKDPREPAPSPEEVGRGAIPLGMGHFEAVRLLDKGVALEYSVGGTPVREQWSVGSGAPEPAIIRHVHVGPSTAPLLLILGKKSAGESLTLDTQPDQMESAKIEEHSSVWMVRVARHSQPITFAVVHGGSKSTSTVPSTSIAGATSRPATRWAQEVVTSVEKSTSTDAYVVDQVALPAQNPWNRKVRASDIQFLADGTGVVVTLDGDVWLAHGLEILTGPVRWRRFASGFHEPMTLAIREEQIYVFDKNGIWRVRDTDGNGEADVHELFSNAFAQTADMREFPATIRLAPHGEFVIAKGGQEDTTLGKHNGSVLRVSADGRSSSVLGYGFRQPNIGVNIRTGLVTSSDQQGQYIPSTPLHIVRDGQYYGFLPKFVPREVYPAPIADPLTWIPHAVDSSALSQVWLFGAKMGPLNDALVHIGFNRPELFRVLLNNRGTRPQAAVVSITHDFHYTPLNGSVNPADGQLYIAGFQVIGWGNVIDTLSGLGRIRYTGAPVTVPREIVPTDRGVLIRFDAALEPHRAADPQSYSLQSWSYRRTHEYGSAQYKADGEPGQDALIPSSAYVSLDRKSVFVGVPGMKPVMQLRIGWSLATAEGTAFSENGYTTPYELCSFDPKAEGFGEINVDLTPRAAFEVAATPVSLEEGKSISQMFACIACHQAEGEVVEKSGPTWRGLFGSQHKVFVAGKPTEVSADDNYLRESILDPAAKISAGFEKSEYAMPSFAGVLTTPQIESLLLYIKSLR